MVRVEYRLCGECLLREAKLTPAELFALIRRPDVRFVETV